RRPDTEPRITVLTIAARGYARGARMRPAMAILHLVRFSPRYFATCVFFAVVVLFCLPIPLGLATRALFDALTGESAGLNAWTAIALLVALQVGEVFASPALGNPWNALQQ